MKTEILALGILAAAVLAPAWSRAESVSAKSQEKIDRYFAFAKQLAADPVIVRQVAAQNAQLPAGYAEMTQGKWTVLSEADPFVRAFTHNPAGEILRARKTADISEAFVSDNRGLKVAFLGKTTYWCHKGKPKHDRPMEGQAWQGKLELDQSAGTMEVQLSVPVWQEGKPIGSLVLGVSLEALTSD